MKSNLARMTPFAAALPLALLLGSCASGGELVDTDVDWIDNPSLISDYLAAAGSAPIASDLALGVARQQAVRSARAELAATLRTRVKSIAEDWNKSTADLTNSETLSAYINNEVFTRQFVDDYINMSRPIKYEKRGQLQYALVVLDDPTKWVRNITGAMSSKLRDDTMLKTEYMKTEFRKRIDRMEAEQTAKIGEARAMFEASYKK